MENGGRLDEVKFLARTNKVEDLDWLDELVTTSNSYSRVNLTEDGQDASNVNYGKVWDVVEPGVLYVKIDDDVVSLRTLQPSPSSSFSVQICLFWFTSQTSFFPMLIKNEADIAKLLAAEISIMLYSQNYYPSI